MTDLDKLYKDIDRSFNSMLDASRDYWIYDCRFADSFYFSITKETSDNWTNSCGYAYSLKYMFLYVLQTYGVGSCDRSKDGYVTYTVGTKKQQIKFGRFLKRYLPWLEDCDVERLVDQLKERYLGCDLDVKVSDKIDKVCRTKVCSSRTTFETSPWHKSLNNSCMRHTFNQDEQPMKAYESGDFEVIYIEDEKGCLVARTIARKENKYYAPIYSTSKGAIDRLEGWLKENGYKSQAENLRSWAGAKLKLIYTTGYDDEEEIDFEGYAIPYLDVVPDAYGKVDENFIIIQDNIHFDTLDSYEESYKRGSIYLKSARGYSD